jgi:hypothetical protein
VLTGGPVRGDLHAPLPVARVAEQAPAFDAGRCWIRPAVAPESGQLATVNAMAEREPRARKRSRTESGSLASTSATPIPTRRPTSFSGSLLQVVHSTSRARAGWRACVAGGAEEPRLARRVRSSKRRRHDAYAAPRCRRTRERRAAGARPKHQRGLAESVASTRQVVLLLAQEGGRRVKSLDSLSKIVQSALTCYPESN